MTDWLGKIARGVKAAQAVMGSDEAGAQGTVPLSGSVSQVNLSVRRKRSSGAVFVRLSLPGAEGALMLDLTPAECRALGQELFRMGDLAAEQANPVSLPKSPSSESET